jgi:hypothetical protein
VLGGACLSPEPIEDRVDHVLGLVHVGAHESGVRHDHPLPLLGDDLRRGDVDGPVVESRDLESDRTPSIVGRSAAFEMNANESSSGWSCECRLS